MTISPFAFVPINGRSYYGSLLDRIQKQRTDNLFTYSVVVVDNDFRESAKEVVCLFKEEASIPVDYYCEPEQNISLARNMALRNARGNYVAFIDDDEFPIDTLASPSV